MAASSITKETNAVAIFVSERSIVRVYDDGELGSKNYTGVVDVEQV